MNIKMLYEILSKNYNLDIDIESEDENLLIFFYSDEFSISELFDEMKLDYNLEYKYESDLIYKFNFIENKSEISSYDELIKYFNELDEYSKLLNNNSEYKFIKENYIGMNKLSDFSYKFYLNHRDLFSFNLNESNNEISELFIELIENSDNLNFKYMIFESLDELIDEIGSDYLYKFRDFNIKLSDENNIIINRNKGYIRNLDENISDELLEDILKDKFYILDLNEIIIDENKIDEFIEIYNVFSEINSSEYYINTSENMKYLFNKLMIDILSFKYYSNQSDYIKINHRFRDENISLDKYEIDSDELIKEIIDSFKYYEIDSYEINEFRKILMLI